MGNKRKRWVHNELDELIKKESEKNGITENEFMKKLGIELKKKKPATKKKKKKEWGFDFKV